MSRETENSMKLGILGAGGIVNRWINGARQVEGLEIWGIASRTRERAEMMAARHGIGRVMSYEEMVSDPEIEAVYIPVPHTAHMELALMAMENKKHVLVEKPMAPNAAQARRMIECARENGVFLMEAVWTYFFPLQREMRKLFCDQGIGEPRMVYGTFGVRVENMPKELRYMNPAMAGGSLLDVGVYPLHFASMVFDSDPGNAVGHAGIDTDDNHYMVDEQAAFTAEFGGGRIAMMASAGCTQLDNRAVVFGTKGRIEMDRFWCPTSMRVILKDGVSEIKMPVPQKVEGIEDEGFQFEIIHMMECVEKGLTSSPVVTPERTLAVLEACDALRSQWGLIYPFEKQDTCGE